MSQGIMHNREAFIANIARRLGRSEPLQTDPGQYSRGIPDHAKQIDLSVEDRISLFSENWTNLTGKVWLVPEHKVHEQIPAILKEIIAALEIERVAMWDHEGLHSLDLENRLSDLQLDVIPWIEMEDGAELLSSENASGSNWEKRSLLLRATERCQLGVVWPDHAVANTGSLILRGGPGRGRSVSLLPGILFGIFREDQIVNRLGEAFAHVGDADNPMPSSYTVITGPSRSADIENDLTIGIHGPGKVFAVIIVKGEQDHETGK